MSGIEWLVEAFGCVASRLRDPGVLSELFREIVAEMGLKPLGEPPVALTLPPIVSAKIVAVSLADNPTTPIVFTLAALT